MKKRILALFLGACMTASLFAGCGGSSNTTSSTASADASAAEEAVSEAASEESSSTEMAAEPTYVLRFGHTMTDADEITVAANEWAEAVKERTNGDLIIEVYPNS